LGNDLLAYVGCIAGAISISDYIAGLKAVGFAAVEVVDTQKDLNAYAQVEGQSGCCSPAQTVSAGCCTPATDSVHGGLAELLCKYDVNEFAASVQVYAVKG